MNRSKALQYFKNYEYIYFITVSGQYQKVNVSEIYKQVYNYLHYFDKDSKIKSVKGITSKSHGVHYHILYFTHKRLDYKKIHEYLQKRNLDHHDVHIELVNKTDNDINDILNYMQKNELGYNSRKHSLKHSLS